MNIFVLNESPFLAARDQHNDHVISQTKESMQMIATTLEQSPVIAEKFERFYRTAPQMIRFSTFMAMLPKPTHVAHPCNVWLRESPNNLTWLINHACGLTDEYQRRYHRVHQYRPLLTVFRQLDKQINPDPSPPANFALAMPLALRGERDRETPANAVRLYRHFYAREKIFQSGAKWKDCPEPFPLWLNEFADEPRIAERLKELAPPKVKLNLVSFPNK